MNVFKFANFIFFLVLMNLFMFDALAIPENNNVDNNAVGDGGSRLRNRLTIRRGEQRLRNPRRRNKSKVLVENEESNVEEKAKVIGLAKTLGVVEPDQVTESKHGLALNSIDLRKRFPMVNKAK